MLNLKEFVMWGLLVLTGLGLVYAKGRSDENIQWVAKTQSEQLQAQAKQEAEREQYTKALAAQSKEWQDYNASSQESARRVVADLRSRGIGLSVELADAKVRCVTGDGRPLADGRAELREETSTALVRIARDADAQVRALQGTVKTLQGGTHE